MAERNVGVVDTNVFVHAHANDPLTAECQAFLSALAAGAVQAHLDPLVVHEMTYVLPRLVREITRADIAAYLLVVLDWPGIQGPLAVLRDAVRRWGRTPGLGFVDAYLAALAALRSSPVYTKNVRDLVGQGVPVPDPLPGSSTL